MKSTYGFQSETVLHKGKGLYENVITCYKPMLSPEQLSNRCEYALYDAASQLQQAITAINYLASECRDDLKTFCSDVKPGEGRLIDCISKNKEKVSSRCKQAIKDVSK